MNIKSIIQHYSRKLSLFPVENLDWLPFSVADNLYLNSVDYENIGLNVQARYNYLVRQVNSGLITRQIIMEELWKYEY